MTAVTIHVLLHGSPLCMFSEHLPCDWPRGHVWVSIDDKPGLKSVGKNVCHECGEQLEKIKVLRGR